MGAQNCTYCQKGTQFNNVNFILVLFLIVVERCCTVVVCLFSLKMT